MNRFAGTKSEQIAYFKAFKGHIHNPGMGIISMAISDHMVTGYNLTDRSIQDKKPPFSITKQMLKEVTDFGYIDNLYIRVGWNDIQKREGKLDIIPEFEMAIEAAKEAGISWGFRIMQASPSNPDEHLLPAFLEGKLPMRSYYDGAYYGPSPKKLPLYTEEYLKYWGEMLQLLGDKYDSDISLEYGDLSGFGLWGEGHHGCHSKPGGPVEDLDVGSKEEIEAVLSRLIQSHKQAFPSTPMVVNLAMAEYQAVQDEVAKGCWVRRDSYYKWFQAEQAECGLQKSGNAAMIFETVAPGLEIEDSVDAAYRHSFFEMPDKMCDYGASYGIVGFNPLDTLYAAHMMPQLYEPFKERVGYRIRPSIVWKVVRNDGKESLALGLVNDGVATPPGAVTITAETNGKKSQCLIEGSELGRKMYLAEIPLPEGYDREVILYMTLTMGKKTYPVRFAADCGEREAGYNLRIFVK